MLWPGPLTTLVVKCASGPSTSSAATAVATFWVDAGVPSWLGSRDHRTWPASSATTADAPEPRAGDDSAPPSARSRPELVGPSSAGSEVEPSTGSAWTSARLATRTGLSMASRAGSIRTRVTPATNVNTLIRASVSKATPRGPRSTAHPPFRVHHGRNQTRLRQTQRYGEQLSQPSTA